MSGVLPDLLLPDASGDAVAIRTTDGRSFSYAGLDDASKLLATQLMGIGVGKGDRVVFQVNKSPMVIVLHLALIRCGAIQVPVNPSYAESEVRAILEDAEPKLLIRDPSCPDVKGRWASVTLDADGGGSLLDLPPIDHRLPDLAASDGAAILFTSGTTGRPKGALLTHSNLAHNALTLVEAWEFTSADHLVHVLPLFHTHGLFVAVHCVLAAGAFMTLLPRFDADQAIDVLGSEPAVSVMMGVPTHYSRLLANPRFDEMASRRMRLFISGSAPMSPALHTEFEVRTGHQVLERYGMTETSMLTSNPVHGTRKAGSVGTPLSGVQVRVVNDDEGPAGSDVGAVEVKGPNVFGGYWARPDLHGEAFTPDGWFRTGDLGRIDHDGYLHLVGRSKDLVITGGLNVYPADVESVLDAIPGVRESAIVGLPDGDLGERVVAVIAVEPDAALTSTDIRTLARTRLAGYQVPKEVVLLPDLPRNAMGKVEKGTLRRLLQPDA